MGQAKWDEFDLENKLWTIPADRFKSGEVHEVPLSDWAVEILSALPRQHGPYIFSTTHGEIPVNGFSKAKVRLDRECQIPDFRLHDLRRTVRTRLSGLKVQDHVAELVIGHGRTGLQRVYDQHGYREEKREALDRWAVTLQGILNPKKSPAK